MLPVTLPEQGALDPVLPEAAECCRAASCRELPDLLLFDDRPADGRGRLEVGLDTDSLAGSIPARG